MSILGTLGIPTTKELADAGVALEDHGVVQLKAALDGVLDRLNGTKVKITDGGIELVIPPATTTGA